MSLEWGMPQWKVVLSAQNYDGKKDCIRIEIETVNRRKVRIVSAEKWHCDRCGNPLDWRSKGYGDMAAKCECGLIYEGTAFNRCSKSSYNRSHYQA